MIFVFILLKSVVFFREFFKNLKLRKLKFQKIIGILKGASWYL